MIDGGKILNILIIVLPQWKVQLSFGLFLRDGSLHLLLRLAKSKGVGVLLYHCFFFEVVKKHLLPQANMIAVFFVKHLPDFLAVLKELPLY